MFVGDGRPWYETDGVPTIDLDAEESAHARIVARRVLQHVDAFDMMQKEPPPMEESHPRYEDGDAPITPPGLTELFATVQPVPPVHDFDADDFSYRMHALTLACKGRVLPVTRDDEPGCLRPAADVVEDAKAFYEFLRAPEGEKGSTLEAELVLDASEAMSAIEQLRDAADQAVDEFRHRVQRVFDGIHVGVK